ncbi:MAG: GNAT family N-acetyltransferase [Haloarculaceae archaeon]
MTAVAVRVAKPDELASVLGVLDAAALATDADRVRAGIDRGDVLVAVPDEGRPDDSAAAGTAAGTVLGALVLDSEEVANVAVRRRRRGQGIGTALVAAAATRRDRLVAECDAAVRPFYESLGFDVEAVDSGRVRGVLDPAEPPE